MKSQSIAIRPERHAEVSFEEYGHGQPILLLHGGAGPQSVLGFAQLLASRHEVRVLVPIHPGFGGTVRPPWLSTISTLAEVYAALLEQLGLRGVCLVGNSIGGWIAAEMAARDSDRVAGLVLVNAVGLEVEDHPVADFFALTPQQVAQYSYHDPATARLPDPSQMSEAERGVLAGNREALRVYGGEAMTDPTLARRLRAVRVPTLVLWGESDRIVDAEYGRAYAAAIPGAQFQLLPQTGHVPQVETPEQLLTALWSFAHQRAVQGSGAQEFRG